MASFDRRITILTTLGLAAALQACDRSDGGEDPTALGEAMAPAVEEFPEAVIAALPDGATVGMLREGREQYGVCVVCHGANAEGTQLGPPFREGQWIHSDGSVEGIERVVRSGVERPRDYPVPMPPMGGGTFDDDQIRALSTYVYALSLGG